MLLVIKDKHCTTCRPVDQCFALLSRALLQDLEEHVLIFAVYYLKQVHGDQRIS